MGLTMKHGCKHIAAILFFLAVSSFVCAQVSVKASIDRNRILVGEPILLSVEAYVPLGESITWFNADSIPHFDITERSKIDTVENIDGKKITQLLSITSFDSGRWQIPAFEVSVADHVYYTDSLSVDVAFVNFDSSADYRDIKGIEEIANPSARFIPWIVAAVSLISLGLLIFMLRKRQKKPESGMPAPMLLSPYAEAMEALEALRRKGLQEGQEKAYYSRLNDIFRVFVFRKYGMSTLERTNEELIMQLSQLKIPKEPFADLTQSLRMSDFVKFAKYRPDENDHKRNLEIIRSSVELLDNNTMMSAV